MKYLNTAQAQVRLMEQGKRLLKSYETYTGRVINLSMPRATANRLTSLAKQYNVPRGILVATLIQSFAERTHGKVDLINSSELKSLGIGVRDAAIGDNVQVGMFLSWDAFNTLCAISTKYGIIRSRFVSTLVKAY